MVKKKLSLLRQDLFRKYKTNDLSTDAHNIEFYRDKTGIEGNEIKKILEAIEDIENSNNFIEHPNHML